MENIFSLLKNRKQLAVENIPSLDYPFFDEAL